MKPTPSLDKLIQQAAAQHRSGSIAAAIAAYEKIVAGHPRAAVAVNLLGLARFQAGDLPKAAAALRRAIQLDPSLPNVEYNLARVLQAMGQHQEALDRYRIIHARMPDDAEVANNIGTALAALGRHQEAIQAYERAIAINPSYWQAWLNLGNANNKLYRYSSAEPAISRAVSLQPDHVEALCALGFTLNCLNRHEEAIGHLQRAVALEPNSAVARINLGAAHGGVGRETESLRSFDRALALDPGNPDADFAKCQLLLASGRFAEGWSLFGSRWNMQWAQPKRPYPQIGWKGERVDGTLLTWGEQGLGDQIMFASMVDELRSYATHVVLEVEPRLVTLLARSLPGVEVVPMLPELYPGPIAAQAPLGDLGLHLRSDRSTFERTADGYLTSDTARARSLRQRLTSDGRRVVGLSWISANKQSSAAKSARLIDLLPVLRTPGCRFVDLQYGDTAAERDEMRQRHGIEISRLADIDTTLDIDGLAALITACDAVLTVSNTTAHLAGASGKAAWVLLPHAFGRYWYWQVDGRRSPFYNSIRICRQQRDQSWSHLVQSIAPEIADYVASDSG